MVSLHGYYGFGGILQGILCSLVYWITMWYAPFLKMHSMLLAVSMNCKNYWHQNLMLLHSWWYTRSVLGNPIVCDCELRWFPAFRNSSIMATTMIGTCDTPINLNGVSLQQITEDQLMCSKQITSVATVFLTASTKWKMLADALLAIQVSLHVINFCVYRP